MGSPGTLQNTGVDSQLFPSPGDLPNPGIKPRSPALQSDSLPAEPQGKPKNTAVNSLSLLQWIFPTQKLNRDLLHCRQILYQLCYEGSPKGDAVAAWAGNARNLSSIPRSGRSAGEGNGHPLQYSCLKNPMDRGVWRALRMAKS